MAQRTVRVDDLNGVSEGARSVSFSLEGTTYDVDLTEDHIIEMRGVMSKFIAVARPRAKSTPSTYSPNNGKGAHTDREQLQEIRRWAHAHGLEFSDRGRIPNHVMSVYNAMAHPATKFNENGVELPNFSSDRSGFSRT